SRNWSAKRQPKLPRKPGTPEPWCTDRSPEPRLPTIVGVVDGVGSDMRSGRRHTWKQRYTARRSVVERVPTWGLGYRMRTVHASHVEGSARWSTALRSGG